jgi:GAF domain-containing protein
MNDRKSMQYSRLEQQASALLADETDRIANAANLAALLFSELPDLNWAGFYFFDGTELVVGPFQGNPACVRIPIGRGVCGLAAETRSTQVVANVQEFSDHIVCDAASNSEIVIPLVLGDALIGVLDLDSPSFDRFDDDDRAGLEKIADLYLGSIS